MALMYRLDFGNTWNPSLTQWRLLAVIAVLFLWVCPRTDAADKVFAKWKRPSEVTATLGRQTVAIPPERLPNKGFPDMPIVVLKERPFTFLMVCGNETYLWSGNTLNQSFPRAQVLAPGPAGSLDNNYAGIASVFHDKPNDKLIAFYHAEDSEGIGKLPLNGVTGFYGRICVAESSTTDLRFSRLGAAITADQPKKLRAWESEGGPMEAWLAQGVGDPSVCVDADGKHLLCVYNELSNRLKAGRGVQLCLARAPIDSAGRPGSWKKNYGGSFSEPGIDGHDTPIISASPLGDTISPQLQYVEAWKRYVLVFAVGIFSEINGKPQKVVESGTYISTSHDALTWSKPVRVKTVFNIFLNGQECLMHPFLVISRATDDQITGQLMYRYTPRWPDNQGYLASTPIRLTLNSEAGNGNRQDLRKKLAGTKWSNSNKVTFEWTKDGRFLHAGKEREWKVLDGTRAQIVFGPGHIDTLEFDDGLKNFKQLIKGGPSSFTGRRQ